MLGRGRDRSRGDLVTAKRQRFRVPDPRSCARVSPPGAARRAVRVRRARPARDRRCRSSASCSAAAAPTAMAVLGIARPGRGRIVVIGAVVVGLVAPRRRYARDAELARWVGMRHAPIASDLLSSVELVAAPRTAGRAVARARRCARRVSTAQRLEAIEPSALAARARGAARAALGARRDRREHRARRARAASLATGWRRPRVAPPAPFDGAQLSAVPLVGDLDVDADGRRRTASAQLARAAVVVGRSARPARHDRRAARRKVLVPARAAELVVEPAAGSGNYREHVPAKLDGDQLTATLVIDRSARYRFAITSPAGARSIEATPRLDRGRGRSSADRAAARARRSARRDELEARRARVRDRGRLRAERRPSSCGNRAKTTARKPITIDAETRSRARAS